MTLAHRSVLLPFLKEIDATPRKGLSQHFLIDPNIVRKIVDAASIVPGDSVLEIGSGPGALTQELLKRGARVFAVEMDPRFARALERLQNGSLQVYEADILEFPFLNILSPFAPLKVVANLPFHIATPIIERLCEHVSLFSSAFLVLQREMADRIVAEPNTKEMGSFSIFVKTYCHASIAVKASRTCFYPTPKTDSSVVKLEFHPPLLENPSPFHTWVRKAYQQRRKMLRSTLSITGPAATKRPEELSLEEWIELYRS